MLVQLIYGYSVDTQRLPSAFFLSALIVSTCFHHDLSSNPCELGGRLFRFNGLEVRRVSIAIFR